MDKPNNDIAKYIYLSEIAGAAAVDTYADFSTVERSYMHWSARALKELIQQDFVTGKRQAIIKVNKNFNTAHIDCDLNDILFVGSIDKRTGEKRPFHRNGNLINTEFIETIPDDIECEAQCTGCFSKALCNDLQTTTTTNVVTLNGVDYNETTTAILLPDGNYSVSVETPFYNNLTSAVEYRTKKTIQEKLEVAPCGCIVETPANATIIQSCNFDCYCTYCSPFCRETEEVGYKVFTETSTIKFDHNFHGDSFFMIWRGSVPKVNGQFVVPAVAKEVLIAKVKYMAIGNKKGVTQWERRDAWDMYLIKLGNFEKMTYKTDVYNLVYNLTKTPSFAYHV